MDRLNNFIETRNLNTILGTIVFLLLVGYLLLKIYLPEKIFIQRNPSNELAYSYEEPEESVKRVSDEVDSKEETIPKKTSTQKKTSKSKKDSKEENSDGIKIPKKINGLDVPRMEADVLDMVDLSFKIPDANNPKKKMDDKFGYDDLFIANVLKATLKHSKNSGIPTCIVIAQAILESDWGNSQLARDHRNYFGIKKKNESMTDRERQLIVGKISIKTGEYVNGKYVTMSEEFNKYNSLEQSVEHYYIFMAKRMESFDGYKKLRGLENDYKKFAKALGKSGFSTDPKYAEKLIRIIENNGLENLL